MAACVRINDGRLCTFAALGVLPIATSASFALALANGGD
jgi:hypothetical protein